MKQKEKAKKAREEFDRLYALGRHSCPALRSMANSGQVTKFHAAQIMGECPIAKKYKVPPALLQLKDDDGTFDNFNKYS